VPFGRAKAALWKIKQEVNMPHIIWEAEDGDISYEIDSIVLRGNKSCRVLIIEAQDYTIQLNESMNGQFSGGWSYYDSYAGLQRQGPANCTLVSTDSQLKVNGQWFEQNRWLKWSVK
jgi:hypothetical protein